MKKRWKMAAIGMAAAVMAICNQGAVMAEEPTEIVFAFPVLADTPADIGEVEAAMNEILLEKCNATISLMPLGFADYSQQVTLMLSGSEKLDLLIDFGTLLPYSSLVQKGQLSDITESIEMYGQDIVSALGEKYLNAAKIEGAYYGVPTCHDLATGFGITMKKEYIDKYNIDVNAIQSLDDLTSIFALINENEPDQYLFYPGGASATAPFNLMLNAYADPLDNFIGVLENPTESLEVTNFFESEQYAHDIALFHEWYEAGYIVPDSASMTDTPAAVLKAGKAIASITGIKPGQSEQDTVTYGTDMVSFQIGNAMSSTSLVTGVMMTVPINATDKDKSVQVLNELYRNEELVNLLNYGIEGKHYVLDENGQVDFAEGVTPENSGYYWSLNWEFGNEFISYTRNTQSADLWIATDQFNKEADISKAMGFSFDNSKVKAAISACENVMNEYRFGLENGQLDPQEYLPEFLEKLNASGIGEIIEEKQSQLDEWAN